MLIHLIPKLFHSEPSSCTLIDLESQELGIHLKAGTDITFRRPYPNKWLQTVCRHKGQKAVTGIFIETDKKPEQFSYTTRWRVLGINELVEHTVQIILLDHDHDALSMDMTLWRELEWPTGEKLPNRYPSLDHYGSIASTQPMMDIHARKRNGDYTDTHLSQNSAIVVKRHEVFHVPTLEVERLVNSPYEYWAKRQPELADAFKAACKTQCQLTARDCRHGQLRVFDDGALC